MFSPWDWTPRPCWHHTEYSAYPLYLNSTIILCVQNVFSSCIVIIPGEYIGVVNHIISQKNQFCTHKEEIFWGVSSLFPPSLFFMFPPRPMYFPRWSFLLVCFYVQFLYYLGLGPVFLSGTGINILRILTTGYTEICYILSSTQTS